MLFKDKYRFLSNMSASEFTYQDVRYLSSEAMYQALKLENVVYRGIFEGLTGKQAKKLGKAIQARGDWDDVKIEVMTFALVCKFLKTDLFKKLQSIEGYIEETNTWNDHFFGVCGGKGYNVLGQLLMLIRDNFSYEQWREYNKDVINSDSLIYVPKMLDIISYIVSQIKIEPESDESHSDEMADVVGYMGDHIY